MENIIASGNEVNPVCLKIFNYLDNKSAIRLSQVNITAWKKFRNDSRFSEIPELKYIIQNSCKFCWEISSGVLNSGNKNEISTIIKLYIRWENKGTNPISGKVWNDVIRRGWVNFTTSVLGYTNSKSKLIVVISWFQLYILMFIMP